MINLKEYEEQARKTYQHNEEYWGRGNQMPIECRKFLTLCQAFREACEALEAMKPKRGVDSEEPHYGDPKMIGELAKQALASIQSKVCLE